MRTIGKEGVCKSYPPDESLEGALTSQRNQNWTLSLFSNFTYSLEIAPSPSTKINNKYEKCLEETRFEEHHVPHLLTNKHRTTIENQQHLNKSKIQARVYSESHDTSFLWKNTLKKMFYNNPLPTAHPIITMRVHGDSHCRGQPGRTWLWCPQN